MSPPETKAACDLCQDLQTVYWDPFDMGPPPPPLDHKYSDPWTWSWQATSIPCPACLEWGKAYNEPWYRARHINMETSQLHPEAVGWKAALRYAANWYASQASVDLVAARRIEEQAHLRWVLADLLRERARGLPEPDWPEQGLSDGCYHCNGFNLGPTRHPRTHRAGVFCCECGAAWFYPRTPEALLADEEEQKQAYQEATRLLHHYGLSAVTTAVLLTKFHPARIISGLRSNPMFDSHVLPMVQL